MIKPIILPPKRFEDCSHHKYDPIRYKPWFSQLIKIRSKIPLLEMAYSMHENNAHVTWDVAAAECMVNKTELTAYAAFKNGKCRLTEQTKKTFQRALDEAYLAYCEEGAEKSFSTYIKRVAKVYGINPHHITEVWDTDPNFYPRGYK